MRFGNIEERLDLRLLNRTTRSVALTEAGERLSRGSARRSAISMTRWGPSTIRGKPVGTLRFTPRDKSDATGVAADRDAGSQSFPDVSVEIVINDALIDTVAAGLMRGPILGETIAADMIAVAIGQDIVSRWWDRRGYESFTSRRPHRMTEGLAVHR